jgi:hypothetical protein
MTLTFLRFENVTHNVNEKLNGVILRFFFQVDDKEGINSIDCISTEINYWNDRNLKI